MSLGSRASRLAAQAKAYAAGNKGKLERGIQQASQAADSKTGGKYHGQIARAGQGADEYLEKLANSDAPKAQPESSAVQDAGEQSQARTNALTLNRPGSGGGSGIGFRRGAGRSVS